MREKLFPYIQSLLDEKLPFLALKKANQSEVQIISQNNQIWYKTEPDKMSYAVFSKFQNNDNHVYIVSDSNVSFNYEVKVLDSKKTLRIIPESGEKEYMKLFEKGMVELSSGRLKKVVLSRKQEFPKNDTDLEIFEKLLDTYLAANGYFFYHPQVGKWMGATPEVLLKTNTNSISTMSLAGTAINDGTDSHRWGEKEKEEQQLVTDFIKDQFAIAGVTEISNNGIETVEAGHLLHLRTMLNGKINENGIEELINLLHPTPAVCGLPRDQAMGFINKSENYDRSYYSGYLGMVNGDSRDYFVNLRCMQLLDKEVSIYVGGGVTLKSDAQLEYQETMAKLQTMYRLL